ncbi:NmrA domain-containing protein [Mycena venus]|uniref:NmrA domain-containing protein n=1 Tax=Mycena venus TaxID=2733690 RepID=A0A8H7D6L7_9AGAR|nr:NmrA domain-containing protein [Mycena venus]
MSSISIASICRWSGVPDPGVEHVESKRLVGEYLKMKHPTLLATVLRPVTFMDELVVGDLKSTLPR